MSDLAEKRAAYQALRYAVAVWVSKDVHVYVEALEAEVSELRSLVGRLTEGAWGLLAVLDAHEVESLDCDRRGDHTCECLTNAANRLRAALEGA
jgi:hypothetical protein